MSELLTLTAVHPQEPGFLILSWNDGTTREVDISDMMTGHPMLEMLQVPEVFQDVSLVDGGGGVEWPNGADFCAQALRMLSDRQTDLDAKGTV